MRLADFAEAVDGSVPSVVGRDGSSEARVSAWTMVLRPGSALSRTTSGGATRGAGYGNQTSQMLFSPSLLRSTTNADSKRSSSA
ncbi:hypothetical protein GCM10010317_102760 [Streptomyces mirabilis]|nr:hypothetical protein GCM10010317_102760 [Streptomyces mirabilis]